MRITEKRIDAIRVKNRAEARLVRTNLRLAYPGFDFIPRSADTGRATILRVVYADSGYAIGWVEETTHVYKGLAQ